MYERECGFDDGAVSGNTVRLKKFTADANLAMDDFTEIALKASGTWEYDDTNQTDLPITKINIVSGQRDYKFLADTAGNLILDVYKVVLIDNNGYGRELTPVYEQGRDTAINWVDNFTNNQDTTGVPLTYSKIGNTIRLNYIPNYSRANALVIYVNRESTYFVYTDTTKKPGVPGTLQKYLYLKPALDHARRNNPSILPRLEQEVFKMEGDNDKGIVGSIGRHFSNRQRDVKPRLVPNRNGNTYRGNASGRLNY